MVDGTGLCPACLDFAYGPPVKHRSVTSPRWALFKWFDIPDSRDQDYTYLRRLRIVQTPWFAFLLHFIFVPDLDQDPHDHPWNFWSFVVRGGYTERFFEFVHDRNFSHFRKRHLRWSLHRMRVEHAHQIDGISPRTCTLLFVGRRQRDWGFWMSEGFIPWKTYNQRKYGFTDKSLGAKSAAPVVVDEFG